MIIQWKTPPAHLHLRPGEVHIWSASLSPSEAILTRLNETLAPDEQTRADRFLFPQHRRRFIASQGYLRQILGRYLHQPPAALVFARTDRGKPFLTRNADIPVGENLRFNVSHSHELAVYAIILEHEIGIDVEHLRPMPDAEHIAARFFSTTEQAALLALPAEDRNLAFFRCWTRKEAFIKAIGAGLYHPLNQFSVSLAPDEPARLLAVHDNPHEAGAWSLTEFIPAPDYIAALAVRAPLTTIAYWRLEE